MSLSQSRKPWLFRATLFAALATMLVWGVTSRTLAYHLALYDPEQALALRARHAVALLNVADQRVGLDPTTISTTDSNADGHDRLAQPLNSEDQKTRAMVESALLDAPLNARALRILGQLANRSHDETRAWQFMQTSARYSLNESFAVAWLVDKSFEKKDYGSA